MFDIVSQQVWLAPGATDMRKSIDGLAAIVSYALKQNPMSQHLFVFCSKDQSKIKVLYWDRNGFWLFYKRLEKGRFRWPAASGAALTISRRQLGWLLEGLSTEQKQAHRPVLAEIVI
jgi:transposase